MHGRVTMACRSPAHGERGVWCGPVMCEGLADMTASWRSVHRKGVD